MIVTQKPVKGSGVIRDFLLSEGIPTARLRKRELFTPYQQRMRIMNENQDKPEEFRTRSLRRKLTKLDRALSDQEAYALDRAFSAWLALNGKSKSVDFKSVGALTGGSEPLNDRELKEAKAFAEMVKAFNPNARFVLIEFFNALAPWNDRIYEIEFKLIVELAKAIKKAYEERK